MKIKSAISTIMFIIFTTLSILGFCILGGTVDIRTNGIPMFLILFAAWIICIVAAVFFYDSRVILRHLYAISCTVVFLYGYIFKKREDLYRHLYELMIESETFSKFYSFLLQTYDACHPERNS